VTNENLTKGKASDLIGLLEPVEEEQEAVLKFFKVSVRSMNQSRARYEVDKLLADPDNAEAWNRRPAESLQKEFLRFFSKRIPKGLTYVEAERMINEHRARLVDDDSARLDEWDSFESIAMDLADKDTREDYGLKKPSLSALRDAIDTLRKEGHSMEELAGDLDLVAQKLIELRPDLERG
jgi:hypothetical protein